MLQIHGRTKTDFFSFYTAPLKKSGDATHGRQAGGRSIKVQVTSTNVGYRHRRKQTNKQKPFYVVVTDKQENMRDWGLPCWAEPRQAREDPR